MTVLHEFLRSLKLRGVHLWSDGNRILYRCRDGSLSINDLDLLSEHRSEILTLLNRVSSPGKKTITPASRDQPLPLSFAQQRLRFLSRLEGASAAYHVSLGLRLTGRLDEASLRRALDRLVYRHESLRTTFGTQDDEPFQRIGPERQGLAVISHDLVGQVEVAATLITLMKLEASTAFDLERGPLIRGRLLRVAADEHVLLLTMHHIVVDGWSLRVLMRELSALYGAYAAGEEDPLAPLAIQYADYAVWQRRWLSHDVLAEQSAYWRETLTGAPSVLELPGDRSRPARQDYSGSFVALEFEERLTGSLKVLSQRHGTTLFMTVLAGWALLLSRLSGQEDVVIGAPSANRNHPQLDGLIGFFVNTLVLRVDLSGAPTVAELLGRVKARVLAAQANQDLPFEQVVELIKPPRSLAHAPLFQVMFAWQNNDAGRLEMPGLGIAEVDTGLPVSKFDLTLSLSESEGRIVGSFEYATALFDRQTIERWGGYLRRTLEAMTQEPRRVAATLPLLSPAERQQLLVEWNVTEAAYPTGCVHELFESRVDCNPGATAVVYEDQSLTYGELNRRANQLAHHLRSLGVGPDVLVAICVERSLQMVIGLLAILKAGGAYVPLDPAYPAQRLRYMLEDSAPAALLVHGATKAALQTLQVGLERSAPIVDLDLDTAWAGQRSENLGARAVGLDAHHLAYVIYTSGSTGQPKGVMVEHANITRLFSSTQPSFHFDHADVWTLFHSFAFDFSVWEIWGALLYGGRLVVVPQLLTRSPDEFYRLLCRDGVTVLNQTPSAFRQMLAAQGRSEERHRLRRVIFGGESLDVSMLGSWYERAENSHTRLANMYGITEITVHGTYRELAAADAASPAGNSPIGGRLPDLKLYILDGVGEPVPRGVAGEIYVGGAGVARGYLNRPLLTAERFVSDPFSAAPGARMYRSGDLGRYLPDAEIEYLGRGDHQVKIRGFRIELGEIEAQLRKCADVREAVVLAREDAPGDKRLVAYLVPKAGANIHTRELHESLQAELSDYMMPGAYVVLDHLPLTQNGKLDRKALPPPEDSAVLHRAFEAPVGEAEQLLAQVWQQVLGLARVGRCDHFFELGGHSLLVIRMLDQLRQRGLKADVAAVFTSPTLSSMAAQLRKEEVEDRDVDVPANLISEGCTQITPELLPLVNLTQHQIDNIVNGVPSGVANVQDIYPLSPLQQGILFHHVLGSERGADPYLLRSVVAFDSRDGLERFLDALQRVIDRHDILRSAMAWQGLQEPVQVVYRKATLVIEEHQLTGSDVPEQLLTLTDPRRTRIDLRCAPLFRAHIAANPARGEWLLALLNHHIIEDNYSLRLVLDEVQQIIRGTQERLPEPLPYRNFIARGCGPRPAEHEHYFREQLRDVAEPTAPFGVLDVLGSGVDVSEATIVLSGELAQRIRRSARTQSVSTAVLFHVVWAQVLAECSGRDDVVFGTVLSGRLQNAVGADRAIGLFINTLPFRLPLQNLSISGAVRQCYERLSQIVLHEQAPLVLTQRCSGVPASLPLFTALLNCRLGNEIRPADGPGRSQPAWAGIRLLRSEERTNYPLYLSVDDLGDDFSLRVQSVAAIDVARVGEYLRNGMHALLGGLASTPHSLMRSLNVVPAGERHELVWRTHTPAARAYEPPIGDVEQAIARLWQKRLAVLRVGRHDHFFELGGDSLQAMQMIETIQNDLNPSVSLAAFLAAPTLANLASLAS